MVGIEPTTYSFLPTSSLLKSLLYKRNRLYIKHVINQIKADNEASLVSRSGAYNATV